MTARVQFVVRHFSLHPHGGELCLKSAPDASRQLGDRKNFGRLLEEIRGQLHSKLNLTTEIVQSAEFIFIQTSR
jgi:hypothetical protein